MASRIDSAQVLIQSAIPPQSVAAAGNAVTGWLDASLGINVLTSINVGALGGGSVQGSWQQATDNSGTGAKAVAAWAAGAAMASNNATQAIDNDPEHLDINNGFKFVQFKLTVTGGAGSLLSATVAAASPRFA